MKFVTFAITFFAIVQISSQFALRNDFEDDDILEFSVLRSVREASPEEFAEHIEASGEEPLPKKSLVKRDKEVIAEPEGSGESSESSEEDDKAEHRPKRSVEALEGSGESVEDAQDAGRQRRVAGEDVIEASGEEVLATATPL